MGMPDGRMTGCILGCPCIQSFKYRLARPLFRGIEQTDLSFRVFSIESFESESLESF